MKAVLVAEAGAQPTVGDIPVPTPAEGQVLVRVHSSSVNSLDVGIAAGMFENMGLPHSYPVTLGRDFTGTVEAVADDVDTLAVGDRVIGEIPFVPPIQNGTWAEYVALDAANVAELPKGVDDAAAGAAPLAAVTALQLIDAAEPVPGQTVLILGVTGGVGIIAAQLAAAAGATVVAPALTEDDQFLRNHGVTELVPRDADLTANVRDLHPDGVDVLIDLVTAYRPTPHDDLVKNGGRIVSATNAAGDGPLRTNVSHDPNANRLARVSQLLADGTVRVPVQATHALHDAATALDAFSNQHTQGKHAVQIA